MSDFKPDPKTVKEWLAPGLWIGHDNSMNLHAESFLVGQGLPATKRTIELLEEKYLEMARKQPNRPTVIQEFHDTPKES